MVTSTTMYTQYKAQTMCKTRFDSQGMILNGFYEKTFLKKKNIYGTRDPLHAIENFHIFLEYIS